jgi:deoxyribonuclease V
VRIRNLHSWDLSPAEATRLQVVLRRRLRERPLDWAKIRRVAGCDCAIAGGEILAAVVVLDLESREVLETADARMPLRFPYVPGLLSFREIPALVAAMEKIRPPDAVLCDGQGRAHPRRFGLACHLGILLGLPTVGVAKSRLVGEAVEPGWHRGSWRPIQHEGETVGRLLRTRDHVKPLWISAGHRIGLDDATDLVLRTGGGYRLPEPTRLADRWVGELARSCRIAP